MLSLSKVPQLYIGKIMDTVNAKKTCTKCNTEKPLYAFSLFKKGYLGRCSICKQCRNKKSSAIPSELKEAERQLAVKAAGARYSAKNKHKRKAKDLVNQAIKVGQITKTNCEHCGSLDNIEGHHPDYSKPLEVIWLCIKCHNLEHIRLRKLTT